MSWRWSLTANRPVPVVVVSRVNQCAPVRAARRGMSISAGRCRHADVASWWVSGRNPAAGSGCPGEPFAPDGGCRQVWACAWWLAPSGSYQPGTPLEASQSPVGSLVQTSAGWVAWPAQTCAPVKRWAGTAIACSANERNHVGQPPPQPGRCRGCHRCGYSLSDNANHRPDEVGAVWCRKGLVVGASGLLFGESAVDVVPPADLVGSSGEEQVGAGVRVDAPRVAVGDPHRPPVRLVFDEAGWRRDLQAPDGGAAGRTLPGR